MNSDAFGVLDAAIREAVGRQGFMRHVGAVIDELAPGRAVLSIERRDDLLQQHGFLHGGVVAFLVDNATTIAAGTLSRAPGQAILTAEYKLNFLAPARGERVICEATVLKPGRRLTVVEAKVYSIEQGQRKIAAAALATIAATEAVTNPGQG